MTPLTDVLRQLHLAVEAAVLAEYQASGTYACQLYDEVVEHLARVSRMLSERREARERESLP